MAIKITWKTTPEISPLYAAAAVASGMPVADPQLAGLIGASVQSISDRLAVADLDVDRFWNGLIAAGDRPRDHRARVEAALLQAGCGELAADSIAPTISGQLADLKIAYAEAFPKLSEQLPLRARVLQEQWEARGPGLIAVIGKLTHRDLMPKKGTVAFVQPALGGGGDASPETGLVWIEAVLANPFPDIPEVVRLGWLLARLGLGRKAASKLVDAKHLPDLAALALLPIVLEAARDVELLGDVELSRLMDAWNTRRINSNCTADSLNQWWSQMREGTTPFPVGLKALDRILTA
ncbi:hypothetical protein [Rosistilla carotiformis]|nr:hypothetical protein [Rosistilla carotiformis]